MCSDWKRQGQEKELTPSEIRGILSNPLFDSIEKFGLSGGETMLREDLAQIAEIVLDSCPKIKIMSVLTNGLEPDLVIKRVKELLALPGLKRVDTFAVSVSIDGYGDTHEKIRRVSRAFERVSETIKRLKELQRETPFYLCSNCVVQPLNITGLVQQSDFGREIGLPITFVPIWVCDLFVEGATAQNALRLTENELKELRILFEGQMESRLLPSNLPFWREYFEIVDGEKRRLPCHLRYLGANLDSDGTLYMCPADSALVYGSVLDTPADELWYSDRAKEIRERAKKYFCPKCTICCDLAFCLGQEFFYYAGFLLQEKSKGLFSRRGPKNG
jgi:MoaA/NifB/PqqE/SkfB family radical SAM enzyme